jgi:hypothetical protein
MTTASGNPGGGFPGSIEVDDVTLYESEDNAWSYLPGKPIPEMAGGRPTLQLYVSNSGAVLQLGTQWTVRSDLLEKLTKEIARRTGRQEVDIQLRPAPASVKEVTVETGDGKGPLVAVSSSSSSGFPPYNAIFRIPMDSAKKDAVVAALNGRAEFLTVRYRATATLKVSAHAVMEGDIGQAAETLGPSSTLPEIVGWINAAVAEGRLKLSVKAIGDADASLLSKAREAVLRRFAQALRNWLGRQEAIPASESVLRVEAVESEMMQRDLDRAGDVSEWFEPGQGQKHITVLPGGDVGPVPTELRVGLGFPVADLPVAFVEARVADKKALLRPPSFEPVLLAAKGTSVQVATHYTTGQPPYKTQVAPGESERLEPAALGLTQITVDGTGRRDAGVESILLHLRFRPSGRGAPEDRTLHLGESQWVASFYVATLGEPVAGEFDLEWTETTAHQQTLRRHTKVKDQTVFVLHEMETPQDTAETNL